MTLFLKCGLLYRLPVLLVWFLFGNKSYLCTEFQVHVWIFEMKGSAQPGLFGFDSR